MIIQKKISLILIPCFLFVLSGCTQDLKSQIAKLESGKQFSQTTINEKQAQVDKLELEVTRLSWGSDALQAHLDKKQSEISKLEGRDGQKDSLTGAQMTTKTEALKKQIDELKAQGDTIRNEKMTVEEQLARLRAVRIKVLTADGKLASAAQMAEILRAVGYKVEKVDTAPAANFSRHTFFTSRIPGSMPKTSPNAWGGQRRCQAPELALRLQHYFSDGEKSQCTK